LINSPPIDSSDPSGRRDFAVSEPILVTFGPSFNIQEQEVFIPLVMDDFNEAIEGFFMVIVAENISNQALDIDLVRGGVTLVNIVDDDRESIVVPRQDLGVHAWGHEKSSSHPHPPPPTHT
jgi:hypothetical protein